MIIIISCVSKLLFLLGSGPGSQFIFKMWIKTMPSQVFFLPSFLVLAQWYIRGGQLVFWSKKDFPVKICPEIFRLCGIISVASWVMGNPADHLIPVVAQHRKWWYAKLPRPKTATRAEVLPLWNHFFQLWPRPSSHSNGWLPICSMQVLGW